MTGIWTAAPESPDGGVMVIEKLMAPLSRVPLFVGLSQSQVAEIARNCERLKFERGETVCKAGQPGDGAFLLVSGTAESVSQIDARQPGDPVPLGSLIGELAMLIEHAYGTTVVARDRVLCLKLTRRALTAQMHSDAALVAHFERCISERLRRLAAELRSVDHSLVKAASTSARANDAPIPAMLRAS